MQAALNEEARLVRLSARSPVETLAAALAAVGLAGLVTLDRPAAQPVGSPQVSTKTIEGECKIGEGGPVLYRSASAHHSCGLYPAPVGSLFLVVDESGEGVDIVPAARGAKLNAPEGKVSTCGRGSMLILVVVTLTTEADGSERAGYDAACVPGPFGPPAVPAYSHP
jgi:hypothetical protein